MKKTITDTLADDFILPEGSLVDLIGTLSKYVRYYKRLGYRNIEYHYSMREECNLLYGDRDETDVEYEKRIEAEKAQQALCKANALKEQEQREARKKYEAEREKNLYLQLKQKYENETNAIDNSRTLDNQEL